MTVYEYKIGDRVIYKDKNAVVRGIQQRDHGMSNLLTLEIPTKNPRKTKIVMAGVEDVRPVVDVGEKMQ